MFSIILKQLRENRGLTQGALARELNVIQSTIGNWEAGLRVPRYNMLVQVARYFNVTVDYLLTGESHASETSLSAPLRRLIMQANRYNLTDEDVDFLIEALKRRKKI